MCSFVEEELSDESDEVADSDSDGYEVIGTQSIRKPSPEKVKMAAQRQQRKEEMKRLHVAQEIQRQLQEVRLANSTLTIISV